MSVTFKQGEDKIVPVDAFEADGTTAVNISACTDIKVALKVNGTLVYVYSLSPNTDEGKLTKDGAITNRVLLQVERSQSKNFAEGQLTAILVVLFTDTDFEEDGKKAVEFKINCGKIIKGEGKDVEIP